MSGIDEPVFHVTERDHVLMWVGKVDVPVVTLENYEKWYSVYVVMPCGYVKKVPVDVMTACMGDDAYYRDHCFHPELLRRIAKHYNGEVHQTALEVATGRWALDIRCDDFFVSQEPEDE